MQFAIGIILRKFRRMSATCRFSFLQKKKSIFLLERTFCITTTMWLFLLFMTMTQNLDGVVNLREMYSYSKVHSYIFYLIRGLCSMKCYSEAIQNLLHFMYKKIHAQFFSLFILCSFTFSFMHALVCQNIPGHFIREKGQGKSKVSLNKKKTKKTIIGFLINQICKIGSTFL